MAYGIAKLDAVRIQITLDDITLISNDNGGNNTIIGSQAGENLTSGGSNMFIGRQIGQSLGGVIQNQVEMLLVAYQVAY